MSEKGVKKSGFNFKDFNQDYKPLRCLKKVEKYWFQFQ